MYDVEINSFWE